MGVHFQPYIYPMKRSQFSCLLFFAFFFQFCMHQAGAQLLKRISENAKRKIEDKANQQVNKAIDDAVDGKPKKPGEKDAKKNTPTNENTAGAQQLEKVGDAKSATEWSSFSKFDFVPGDKVLAFEDFTVDAVGDFPARWNTDASGEIVQLNNSKVHYLKIASHGAFYPEFIQTLPANFTLEFDLQTNPGFSYYSNWFTIALANLKAPAKNFMLWKRFGRANENRNGFELGMHPASAGNQRGRAFYVKHVDDEKTMTNEVEIDGMNPKRTVARISIWKQGQRIRVYVNEFKIFDLPKAFDAAMVLNSVVFGYGGGKEEDAYYLSNLRLAASSPAIVANKLMETGKFSTTGILFDFQQATIRPESYNVIKEIAMALEGTPDMKLKVIGHTSNDGAADANLALSKKRALAVCAFLIDNFNIAADRLSTDGKGGSELVDKGTTPEAKANNRRVEFVKW